MISLTVRLPLMFVIWDLLEILLVMLMTTPMMMELMGADDNADDDAQWKFVGRLDLGLA